MVKNFKSEPAAFLLMVAGSLGLMAGVLLPWSPLGDGEGGYLGEGKSYFFETSGIEIYGLGFGVLIFAIGLTMLAILLANFGDNAKEKFRTNLFKKDIFGLPQKAVLSSLAISSLLLLFSFSFNRNFPEIRFGVWIAYAGAGIAILGGLILLIADKDSFLDTKTSLSPSSILKITALLPIPVVVALVFPFRSVLDAAVRFLPYETGQTFFHISVTDRELRGTGTIILALLLFLFLIWLVRNQIWLMRKKVVPASHKKAYGRYYGQTEDNKGVPASFYLMASTALVFVNLPFFTRVFNNSFGLFSYYADFGGGGGLGVANWVVLIYALLIFTIVVRDIRKSRGISIN